MDDFSIFGPSFETCLKQLIKVLKRCMETNLGFVVVVVDFFVSWLVVCCPFLLSWTN